MGEVVTSDDALEEDLGPDSRIGLKLTDIEKSFHAVRALSSVSLEVAYGEIHALVGENGAGKSTLMAIAAGALAADAGVVEIGGQRLVEADPELARELGLSIVYQHPALLADLTVAENLWLGMVEADRPAMSHLNEWADEALAQWGGRRRISPRTFLRDLGPDARFVVEITKAITAKPKVLVLDEPTEHLPGDEVGLLFERVGELAARGTAVMYISHRIPEVRQISSRISVLRDGVARGTFTTASVSEPEIVNRIVGRSIEAVFPAKSDREHGHEPIAKISGLSGDHFSGIDLEVRSGEIIGLAGVEGNGQHEVLRALSGLYPAKGEMTVGGSSVRLGNPPRAAAAGVAYLSADRAGEAIFPTIGVAENITAGILPEVASAGLVNGGALRSRANQLVDRFGVKTASLDAPIETLSGGNQQKTVLGRMLDADPRLILVDEPTQGVDVGARINIYHLLRDAVNQGAGAVIVSFDAAELEGLCDRVIVLSRGQAAKELSGDALTEHAITEAALTSTKSVAGNGKERSISGWSRFIRGDYAPAAILAVFFLALGIVTAISSEFYLTGANFNSMLMLFAALAFAGMAQQVVLLVGGIDLSIGPLIGFLVVVASFVVTASGAPLALTLGLALTALLALAVGVANWIPWLIGVPPFLATLVTFTGLQGLSLLLRPLPGGKISSDLMDLVALKIGFVPIFAIGALAVALLLEFGLRRRPWGIRLRATGSNLQVAKQVGVRTRATLLSAYLTGGLLAFAGSLLLMGQVGVGDPTVGINYTLLSIAAAVLGGASIFGGRGAFIGAILGALLIQQINSSVVFLKIDTSWQSYLLGALTLIAAAFYSLARDSKRG